jgi:hypothetical protein
MPILNHTLAALAFTVAVSAGAQPAQKASDFTGQWELNAAKSDLGGAPAPKLSATIAQNDTLFTFTQRVGTPAGEQSATQAFPLKPGPQTWNTPAGQPVTTTATWEGGSLVITTKAQRQGVEMTQVNKWQLSPDGKTMTMLQDMASPSGAVTLRLVFDRRS